MRNGVICMSRSVPRPRGTVQNQFDRENPAAQTQLTSPGFLKES
jgi:hypothetical protein